MLILKFTTFIGIVVLLDSIQATDITKSLLRGENSFCSPFLTWKRPEHVVPFPHEWHTFTAKSIHNPKEEVEYIIKDIPEDRYDEVVDLMALYILKYEPLYVALKFWNDSEVIKHFKAEWRRQLKQKLSVACFRNDGSDEIIGISILTVVEKADIISKTIATYINDKLDEFISLIRDLYSFDTFQKYGVKEYLTSDGFGIDPKYKNTGIDVELVKISEKICRTFGIKLTSSIFISDPMNKIADKLRFKPNNDRSYRDMRQIFGIIPPVVTGICLKTLVIS
ncbi:uncharacterized protein LOC116344280 [Contarinia nasturtii]|uniref:uncharacterized protein LOC116344280 n=1 Tax=Contarinia nasturtii TaxID=265458 RepID=UPI0012D4B186|nr:uncharacterized protein LOC116344280 [Contarinia nasturtii]